MPRSVDIVPVKACVLLSEKRIHHLIASDSFPEGMIPLDVSHAVNHKHPKNLIVSVLNTTMERVSMKKYTILGKLNLLNIDGCKVNKFDTYVSTQPK